MRLCWIFLLLVGCGPIVPATTPPQLANTPGASIRITSDRVQTESFSVRYPDGWRVVKISPAVAPLRLVFVAPDDAQIIELGTTSLDPLTPDATTTIVNEIVQLGNASIYVRGSGPTTAAASLRQHIAAIIASLQALPSEA